MKVKIDLETLKRVGAIIIVGCAFCIILPGVGQYVASLARFAIFITIVIAVAFVAAIVWIKVSGRKSEAKVEGNTAEKNN